MSIRWIRNVMIDSEESTLEIQLGYTTIGDRCYIRVGSDLEEYFTPISQHRAGIIEEGIAQLQNKLSTNSVTTIEGNLYDWQ